MECKNNTMDYQRNWNELKETMSFKVKDEGLSYEERHHASLVVLTMVEIEHKEILGKAAAKKKPSRSKSAIDKSEETKLGDENTMKNEIPA